MGTRLERGVVSSTEHRNPERIPIVPRIRPININNSNELSAVLKMFRDPVNRDHIANIREDMEVSDLVKHYDYNAVYKPTGRRGYVALEGNRVVGVFDLTLQGEGINVEAPVVLVGGMLNKLCVASDLQTQGIGKRLREESERIAFQELKWPNLLAAIVLDEKQTEESREALRTPGGWGKFIDKFAGRLEKADPSVKGDPRGKLFLRDGKWEARGTVEENVYVGSTGKQHDVLMVTKTRSKWEEEHGVIQPTA